ncbi:MAG: hypothetical protein ABIO46_01670 [Chitinophagales bacterium]
MQNVAAGTFLLTINRKIVAFCGLFILSATTLAAQITLVKECDLLNWYH